MITASLRRFLFACSLFLGLCCAPGAFSLAQDEDLEGMPTEVPGYSMDDLRRLADRIVRTGLGTDSIPAITSPEYLSISDASLSMENNEVVFLVFFPGNLLRIYPQRIMVWHEVVSDALPDPDGKAFDRNAPDMAQVADKRYTISYSPLTGSVVAFHSRAGQYATSFGVTGNLLNGNTVLYDAISRSLWSQLLGACLEGPLRGKRLDRIPVLWARWGGVKEHFGGLNPSFDGKVEVLSRATGYTRSYGKDPYGSYQRAGTYYDDASIPFPVARLDTRLPAKKAVLGIESESAFAAVQKDAVKEIRTLNFSLGVTPLVAIYDESIDAVRVFHRRLPGFDKDLTFAIFEDKLIDEQTHSEWLPDGRCVNGKFRDRTLKTMYSVDSMWFAWSSFYRGSSIFPAPYTAR
jgi:hypothetical protein